MDFSELFVIGAAALSASFVGLFFFGPRGRTRGIVSADGVQRVELTVEGGYRPDRIVLKAGTPVRLHTLRTDHSPCSEQIVLPDLGISKRLPTGKVVDIDLPGLAPGEYEFTCGMKMMRGRLLVEA